MNPAKPRETTGTDVPTLARTVANAPLEAPASERCSGYARCWTITEKGRAYLDGGKRATHHELRAPLDWSQYAASRPVAVGQQGQIARHRSPSVLPRCAS